ncbi:Uncharacterized membrane protein YcaP, DUF421 family [Gracilibacillus ureilyticus]|uniref:Uncharacterized membrane protein YcaP, DUF421 family n=1 Tax=Gracilibacillus ureilyticus TaxID=531814 RepID=A0A1H9VX34_9BACI|nr:DUF421 domain-containing protein [Gracilibacillus ureilyticus]SES26098.1 Uncharacterized membrane protein YcaP, DUF421 family [Gracilibacillus ureilyticus]
MQFGSIFIETLFGFVTLFILAKLLGKTQIKQLTAFDFISALILGELVGNALYDKEVGIPEIGFAVALWGVLLFITEITTQKIKKSRSLLEGSPSIVIHKGKLQRDIMRKGKLDMNQLLHLLRAKDVFSVQEVDYAILETDGTLSVVKKTNYQPLSRQDLDLPLQEILLPAMIINDGEIIKDNLEEIGKDNDWLVEELRKQDVNSIKDVFYAEYDKKNGLYIQQQNK